MNLPRMVGATTLVSASLLMVADAACGDAIVLTRAMNATTIAELFIEDDAIRLKLEIGLSDLKGFRNLLPDELYERLGYESVPFDERLPRFFNEDFMLRLDDGEPLIGQLVAMAPRPRIMRDEITGEPLPVAEEEAELVIDVEFRYPLDRHPGALSLAPPRHEESGFVAATIGFVVYHEGLAVNDFRYLGQPETLDLDWNDPWYSTFRNRNLRRQFNAPISAFLYVDHYEVRKEIVVRPKELQQWVDLGLEGKTIIPADIQGALKQQVADYLAPLNPVLIDGRVIEPVLDRVHFIRRTLRTTGVIDPPEDLPMVSATLGVIFAYPITSLPGEVTMDWELFSDRIQSVPASATDEAGSLPSIVTPDDPVLRWTNYLKNPSNPGLIDLAPPPQRAGLSVPLLSAGCVILLVVLVVRQIKRASSWRPGVIVAGIALLAGAAGGWPFARIDVSNPLSRSNLISDTEAQTVVAGLMKNIYRAFDYRDESVIYDTLERSASGDLLTQIYLETRRALELQNQGGARVKVTEVAVLDAATTVLSDEIGFVSRCTWNVTGSVGHWGHLHQRRNQYEAEFTVKAVNGIWKITTLQLMSEQRM